MKSDEFQKLNRINSSIPRHLIKKLVKTKKAFPGQKELMKKALDDPQTPENMKAIIRKSLEDCVYDKVVSEVDPKVAKQIEEHIDGDMQYQIKKGNLKPKADPWYQRQINKK